LGLASKNGFSAAILRDTPRGLGKPPRPLRAIERRGARESLHYDRGCAAKVGRRGRTKPNPNAGPRRCERRRSRPALSPNISQAFHRNIEPAGCWFAILIGCINKRKNAPANRTNATVWSSGVLPGKTSGIIEQTKNRSDHAGARTKRGSGGFSRCLRQTAQASGGSTSVTPLRSPPGIFERGHQRGSPSTQFESSSASINRCDLPLANQFP